MEIGVFLRDEHGAARRVAAGKRTLRPAQHFDAGDVVIGLALEISGQGRDAIPIGHDADADGAAWFALADAADVEIVALSGRVHGQRRRGELKLLDGIDALAHQILTAQHRRSDTGALQACAAPLGGHDDVVRCLLTVIGLGRSGRIGRSGR
ncbi:hypothetical protein O6027_03125 [Sphingomonas aerolata]